MPYFEKIGARRVALRRGGRDHHKGRGMEARAICAARPAQGCHSAGDPPCVPPSRVWRRFCEIQIFTPNQHPLKGPKCGHVAVENRFSNFAICSRFGRINPTSHVKSNSVFTRVPYFEKFGAQRAARWGPVGFRMGEPTMARRVPIRTGACPPGSCAAGPRQPPAGPTTAGQV